MGEFLAYSLISGVVLPVLYLAYRLLLARENQPGFNRGVLLAIYGLSFLTPLLMTLFIRVIGYFTAVHKTVSLSGAIRGTATPIAQPLWCTLVIWLFATKHDPHR